MSVSTSLRYVGALVLVLALGACNRPEPTAEPGADAALIAAAPSESTPEPEGDPVVEIERPRACELVTEQEMSKILGAPVVADGVDDSERTLCRYQARKDGQTQVEFGMAWGHGPMAMNMARMAAQVQPQVAQKYKDLGDEAALVGTTLMIRTGEDLVTLVMSEQVKDMTGKARRILDTAKTRL